MSPHWQDRLQREVPPGTLVELLDGQERHRTQGETARDVAEILVGFAIGTSVSGRQLGHEEYLIQQPEQPGRVCHLTIPVQRIGVFNSVIPGGLYWRGLVQGTVAPFRISITSGLFGVSVKGANRNVLGQLVEVKNAKLDQNQLRDIQRVQDSPIPKLSKKLLKDKFTHSGSTIKTTLNPRVTIEPLDETISIVTATTMPPSGLMDYRLGVAEFFALRDAVAALAK